MAQGGYKIRDQFSQYFLTFQVVYWIDIFTRQIYRDIFLDVLKYYQREQGLLVHCYVIMSNHIHLILSATQPKNDLSSIIGRIKSFSSKKIIDKIKKEPESRREWMLWMLERAAKKHSRNTQYQLWTHENHPVDLDSAKMTHQRLDYIHENPVSAGIVSEPKEYLYSSARQYEGEVGLLKIDFLD